MSKLLSIIIPTYNAAKFLDKGLTSMIMDDKDLMDQLEVIVVIDGSPDNSIEIAQKYVDMHPNTFRILDKENGGHGSGINAGSKFATGKYFKVIDADDWVTPELLAANMKALAETETVDAMIQSFRLIDIYESEENPKQIPIKVKLFDVENHPDHIYTMKDIVDHWDICGRGCEFHGITYNREFYLGLHYDVAEKVFYEDQEYATIPLSYAQRVLIREEELYMYRVGDMNQSVSCQRQLSRLPHFETVLNRIMDHEKNTDSLPIGGKEYWMKKLSLYIGSIYQICLIKNPNKKDKREYIQNLNKQIEEKSPFIYGQVVNKYKAFVILNKMHMGDAFYARVFTRLLRFARRVFKVGKLYA